STMYLVVTDSGVDWLRNDVPAPYDFEHGVFCGYHDTLTVPGYGRVRYVALPHVYDVAVCRPQAGSPNNDPAGDATLPWLVHEIEETVTDPDGDIPGSGAWADVQRNEVGDKCQTLYAPTYAARGANASANVHLGTPNPGGKDVLIQ